MKNIIAMIILRQDGFLDIKLNKFFIIRKNLFLLLSLEPMIQEINCTNYLEKAGMFVFLRLVAHL